MSLRNTASCRIIVGHIVVDIRGLQCDCLWLHSIGRHKWVLTIYILVLNTSFPVIIQSYKHHYFNLYLLLVLCVAVSCVIAAAWAVKLDSILKPVVSSR